MVETIFGSHFSKLFYFKNEEIAIFFKKYCSGSRYIKNSAVNSKTVVDDNLASIQTKQRLSKTTSWVDLTDNTLQNHMANIL